VTDLYSILGVAPTATQPEIKKAWRAAMKVSHPDAGGTAADTMRVQAAYDVLGDPVLRAEYDRKFQASPSDHDRRQTEDQLAELITIIAETLAREIAEQLAQVLAETWLSGAGQDGFTDDPQELLIELRDRTETACAANTAEGRPCLRDRSEATVYCWQHLAQLKRGDLPVTRLTDGRPQCAAVTQAGRRCRSTAAVGGLCLRHGGTPHAPVRRIVPGEPISEPGPTKTNWALVLIVAAALMATFIMLR
jgi:DnaJ-domain-containing protein 1